MIKYFDDVSRDNSIGWTPSVEFGIGSVGSSIDMDRVKRQAAKEKAEAMRRLFGHDAQSASTLSEEQVRDETLSWAKDSGLVGDKAKYDALLGMDVASDSQTLVSCLAGFWSSVAAFVHDNADEHHPTDIWKTDGLEFSRVFMLIFPHCAELYDYGTMKTLTSAVEFCKDSCTHYGRKFELTLFHPRYENAPKMISPKRHSPFPSLGLHVYGEYDARSADAAQFDYEDNDAVGESSKMEEGSITSAHLDDFIPQLSERKRSLEALFNSPAALSPVDARAFGHSYQEMSDKEVVAATKQWIDQSVDNTALKYTDTEDDRWAVSGATIAEEAYADVWNEISKLYDYGMQLENIGRDRDDISNVISTMFITKTFSSYSATEFKRFAVTVNAALKHLTRGKIFLEPFHPEYVGKVGAQHENRRSPFPTIQICYRFGSRWVD